MRKSERIAKVEEALELVHKARDMVRESIQGTGHVAHYEAYGEYGFKQLTGNGNPFDGTLDKLIGYFQESKKEDYDEVDRLLQIVHDLSDEVEVHPTRTVLKKLTYEQHPQFGKDMIQAVVTGWYEGWMTQKIIDKNPNLF